jgi:hypothetical protein
MGRGHQVALSRHGPPPSSPSHQPARPPQPRTQVRRSRTQRSMEMSRLAKPTPVYATRTLPTTTPASHPSAALSSPRHVAATSPRRSAGPQAESTTSCSIRTARAPPATRTVPAPAPRSAKARAKTGKRASPCSARPRCPGCAPRILPRRAARVSSNQTSPAFRPPGPGFVVSERRRLRARRTNPHRPNRAARTPTAIREKECAESAQ